MTFENTEKRLRRARKTRGKIRTQGVPRLSVHKSGKHFYAQLIESSQGIKVRTSDKVLCSASTLEKGIREGLAKTWDTDAAKKVAEVLAERIKQVNVKKFAFDRSGYSYHGKIEAFVTKLRDAGLEI
jgi:large subunit ribosomal protein L18